MSKSKAVASSVALAAVLVLGGTAVLAAGFSGGPNHHGITPGGKAGSNRTMTHEDTMNTCGNTASHASARGPDLAAYLASCESGG